MSVSAFALFALGFAATVREACVESSIRWTARGIGAVGVAVLMMFTWRVSTENAELKSQIAARTKAKGVSEQHGASTYTVTLKNGKAITWSPDDAGIRPMPPLAGCSRSGSVTYRAGDGVDRGQYAPTDSMPFGQSWQWASAGGAIADGTANAKRHPPDF